MTPAPDPASVTVAVSILAPAYNEEAVIRTFAEAVLRDIPLGSELLIVDDRSWPRDLIIIGIGTTFLSWFGHTVLFFGYPRFRCAIETTLAILVALKEGARHGFIAQQVTHGGAVDAPAGDA
jgi:hypothetical protein